MKFIRKVLLRPATILALAVLVWVGWYLGGKQTAGYTLRTERYAGYFQLQKGADPWTKMGLPSEKLDVNTASVEELEAVAGLGRAKAEAIVERRKNEGFFYSMEELTEVDGIGEELLKQLCLYLTVK